MGVPATTGQQRNNIADMQIGDYIPCRYIASSGAAGTFSELGTCIAAEIPVAGTATPDGKFYFIKVDKGLLIADRIIQHSISWATLNTAQFINGLILPITNAEIPIMTSNTAPSGIASASSIYSTSYDAWKVFDAGTYSGGQLYFHANAKSAWVAYEYPSPVIVDSYGFKTIDGYPDRCPKSWTFEAWDGFQWIVLHTGSLAVGNGSANLYRFNNNTAYSKYRLNISNTFGGMISLDYVWMNPIYKKIRSLTGGITFRDVSGNPVIKESTSIVPAMTANDIPAPFVVLASSEYDGVNYPAYHLFDQLGNYCWCNAGGNTGWVCIDIGSAQVVKKYKVQADFNTTTVYNPSTWTFEGSNDGNNWTVLDTQTNIQGWSSNLVKPFFIPNNNTAYKYYKINITATAGNGGYIQFSGLELDTDIPYGWPENEWDKYIVDSDLNGSIVAGDNAVWHWNVNIGNLVQETPHLSMLRTLDGAAASSSYRIARGPSSWSSPLIKAITFISATSADAGLGFRPVLEFDESDNKVTNLFH